MKGQRYRHITQTAIGERETGKQHGEIVFGIHLFIQQMFIEHLLCVRLCAGARNTVVRKPGTVLTHIELILS